MITAARTLRTVTRLHGPNPSSPQAVAGKVSEKAVTPSAARTVPPRVAFAVRGWVQDVPRCPRRGPRRLSTAIPVAVVALFSVLMHERSSVGELAERLREELDRYSPGGKLPSSRALVERFRVSPVTVSRALAQLAAEGLVVTRPGAGAFRAEPVPRHSRPVTPPGRRSR